MASSIRSSPNAFVAEVARYLAVEPEDVQRMIRSDKLPHLKIPKATRVVHRIPLRDLHAWLRLRSGGTALESYAEFLTDFDQGARTPILP